MLSNSERSSPDILHRRSQPNMLQCCIGKGCSSQSLGPDNVSQRVSHRQKWLHMLCKCCEEMKDCEDYSRTPQRVSKYAAIKQGVWPLAFKDWRKGCVEISGLSCYLSVRRGTYPTVFRDTTRHIGTLTSDAQRKGETESQGVRPLARHGGKTQIGTPWAKSCPSISRSRCRKVKSPEHHLTLRRGTALLSNDGKGDHI